MRDGLQNWFDARRPGPGDFSGSILFDSPLSDHTYYKIGGSARVIVSPQNSRDLLWLSRALLETGTDFFILGAGTNVLAPDEGFDGLIIKTGSLDKTIVEASSAHGQCIRTGAAASLSKLVSAAAEKGWSGFECFAGIPGLVGGAVAMNAGTSSGEVRDLALGVECVDLFSGKPISYCGPDLLFSYRKNGFLRSNEIISSVRWRLHRGDPATISSTVARYLSRRRVCHPVDQPSCGSVFKNPSGTLKAWQVIEKLGLRGQRVGGAQFSEKHCNFIINLGNALASDVRALVALARSRAHAELGITLEEEMLYMDPNSASGFSKMR
ncbi:MAG: UDP-N-acetylenolpyruvoylglucosamine reductase [Bdellovibrionales bacterium RIFOXYD1_FULL_53_11]|nr:MAG: UDP-N-acetylenolpyruvoylglucosamine reductase [Bdellovibrionales bacterium RIFOXYD1_FULL_53_11]